MPIRRFIINPPKSMAEKDVTEAAGKMFAALKGIDTDAQLEKPVEPSQPVQDTLESVDAVKPADGQDEGEANGDSDDEDGGDAE